MSAIKSECPQDWLQELNSSSSTNECLHPLLCSGICRLCGQRINDNNKSVIPMRYIHKNLNITVEGAEQLRQSKQKSFFHEKKLCLVLDLDLTLLHSVAVKKLSPREKYLLTEAYSSQENPTGSLFMTQRNSMITKLRPNVRAFLEEASRMYEMYVYTMGSSSYASEMAKILDPEGEYFDYRVISRDDCTRKHKKGLDLVMAPESMIVVLDDTKSVWDKHINNVIRMKKYEYFSYGRVARSSSLSESKKDESEREGVLARVIEFLKLVHKMFYSSEVGLDAAAKDVRLVVKAFQQQAQDECGLLKMITESILWTLQLCSRKE